VSLATAAGFAVAHYAFDEASGNLVDSINSHTATEVGTVPSTTGKFDEGRDFERGDTDGFTHADHADFRIGDNAYTISMWWKPETLDATQVLVCKGDGTNGSYAIVTTSAPAAVAQIFGGSGYSSFVSATSGGAVSLGTWNLLIYKHDPTANVVGISLNGAAFNTNSHAGGAFDGTEGLRIGFDEFANRADGVMDELVFMQGHAFSDADAAELWNSGTGVAFADWAAAPAATPKRLMLLGVG
jgi:hypothetical protein